MRNLRCQHLIPNPRETLCKYQDPAYIFSEETIRQTYITQWAPKTRADSHTNQIESIAQIDDRSRRIIRFRNLGDGAQYSR